MNFYKIHNIWNSVLFTSIFEFEANKENEKKTDENVKNGKMLEIRNEKWTKMVLKARFVRWKSDSIEK